MASDPLEKFKRKGTEASVERSESPSVLKPKPGGLKPYVAHEGKDKVLSLDIHRVLGPSHSPAYRYLYNISYDNEYFSNFALEFGFMKAKVRGRNLRDIVASIKRHTCEFIQYFHVYKHENPRDSDLIVTSIAIERDGDRGDKMDADNYD